jgi:hypothetical protein
MAHQILGNPETSILAGLVTELLFLTIILDASDTFLHFVLHFSTSMILVVIHRQVDNGGMSDGSRDPERGLAYNAEGTLCT